MHAIPPPLSLRLEVGDSWHKDVELVLGLFALAMVAMIFYPFLAVLLIINRKIINKSILAYR